MMKALILSAALVGLGMSIPSAQAAGPMSPTGIKAAASSSSATVQEVARRRVCRRSCVVKRFGFKKRRVCHSVCRWR